VPNHVQAALSLPLLQYRRLLMKDGPALLRMEKEVEGKVKVRAGSWTGWCMRQPWGVSCRVQQLVSLLGMQQPGAVSCSLLAIHCLQTPAAREAWWSATLRQPAAPTICLQYDTGDTSYRRLLMLVQQLRKCCNHP
jgi:hypothetical protein